MSSDSKAASEWVDSPLPEDEDIWAAHPIRTGNHDLYAEAQRLVTARHSKRSLVELVNWLLLRAITAEAGTELRRAPPPPPPCKLLPRGKGVESYSSRLIAALITLPPGPSLKCLGRVVYGDSRYAKRVRSLLAVLEEQGRVRKDPATGFWCAEQLVKE